MYDCKTCHKEFSFLKNLKRHMVNIHQQTVEKKKRRISIQESDHKCPVCQLAFIERSSLRRHELMKHKEHITPSLKASKPKTCITIFEKSNLNNFPQLKKLLPEDYTYKVNQIEQFKNGKFKAKFEIADCSKEIFFKWLSELSDKSLTIYKVKSFTKSPNPKTLFNKCYRCDHNTFPSKKFNPHPKHTGCLAFLSVRVQKCSEALSVSSSIANNNMCMIYQKAFVTLNHCHNHYMSKTNDLSHSIDNELTQTNEEHFSEILLNHFEPDNSSNQVYSIESNNLNSMNMFDETTMVYEPENKDTTMSYEPENYDTTMSYETENQLALDDYIQEIYVNNDDFTLDSNEEFDCDKYILVEIKNIENTLDNDNCDTNILLENTSDNDNTDHIIHQPSNNYIVLDNLMYTFNSSPSYAIL